MASPLSDTARRENAPLPAPPAGVAPGAERARRALAGASRIAVVTKFRFMGDTIVATPFLKRLRESFPNAEITLLTSGSAAVALKGCPHLSAIVPLGYDRGRIGLSVAQWRILRRGRFDAVFLLNRSLDAALMSVLARVPVRVGYATDGRGALLTLGVPYALDGHEVDSHLDVLRTLGLPAAPALPELWLTPDEEAEAEARLRESGWDGRSLLIGVQPGANDPEIREWGADRFARVTDTLCAELSAQPVLMGGKEERATADRAAVLMQHPAINLVGVLNLRQALAVIGRCGLWLGNDSGLLHAAVAQRVPSVGLFGPNKAGRWGYDTPRHRSLAAFLDEPACDDAAVRRALNAVTEEEALDTARAALTHLPAEHWPGRTTPYFVPPAHVAPPTRRR